MKETGQIVCGEAAVRYANDFNPNKIECHPLLADILRADRRFEEARLTYPVVAALNPAQADGNNVVAKSSIH
jgi:hypothetical protein